MSADVDTARSLIEGMIRELSARDHRIHDDLAQSRQPAEGGFSDRATERQNDEVLKRIEESTRSELLQARHALERLQAGLYGTCERCGYEIEPRRLERMPQATQCSECAAVRH